jgi:UDP-N-acetylglucosamine transferase subunit ALG13
VRDLVFVTVGTDHHPFDRLVTWADAWVMSGRANGTECLIQTGTSQPPQRAGWRDYLRYDEMVEAMQRSVAVVCHGGPATIMDARRLGRVPIVVPRSSRLGEHVDDHQQRFAARMAELGQVHRPQTQDELFELLDRALADPGAYELHETGDGIAEAIGCFDKMVSELVNGRQAPEHERAHGPR